MLLSRTYVFGWLRALVLTELVEAPLYRRLLGVSWLVALGASAITHPFVWFVFPPLGERFERSWTETAVASEIFAWWVEAAWFFTLASLRREKRPSLANVIVVTLVVNGASVATGLVSRWLTGWP